MNPRHRDAATTWDHEDGCVPGRVDDSSRRRAKRDRRWGLSRAKRPCHHPPSVSGRAKAALLLAAVAALAVGCRPAQPRSAPVVLIVVDALRPDHLGYYGYDLPTSPQLDGWMASGRVYERAFATSSWTLPSFASMFTGQLPARHGAGVQTRRKKRRTFTRLDAGLPTLAEIFREHGYATGAIVGNAALAPVFGLKRGFDTYDYIPATNEQMRRADVTVQRALAWIDQQEGRPFFSSIPT